MKKAIAILAVLSLAALAGQVAVNLDPIQGSDADWLTYDDGTPNWYTWGGVYRGVWFNCEDFIPGAVGISVTQSEVWFYHGVSSGNVWDTSDVYIEIWNGDSMAPVTQLDQTMGVAAHYAPMYTTYATPLMGEANLWCIVNTELSAGGWPSVLGDGTPGVNSFFSDDFIIWEPWGDMGDYMIAIEGDIDPGALSSSSWGSLKAAF